MTEKEIISEELKRIEDMREKLKANLQDLTQHLGTLNCLSNVMRDALNGIVDGDDEKNSSES